MPHCTKRLIFLIAGTFISLLAFSQFNPGEVSWTADGKGFTTFKNGSLVKTDLTTYAETILVTKEQLIPAGKTTPLSFDIYKFSTDNTKLLIYTNTAKV